MADELSEVEVVEPGEAEGGGFAGDPFAPPRLVGVALAGAIASLILYSLWVQIEPEKREKLKESVVGAVKAQVRNWSQEE